MASPAKKVTYSTARNGQGNYSGAMNSRGGNSNTTQQAQAATAALAAYFDFPAGIIRRIPDSLADQALRMDDSVVVDIDLARRQHEKLIMTLRKLNVGLTGKYGQFSRSRTKSSMKTVFFIFFGSHPGPGAASSNPYNFPVCH